ncbi:hypothetical protein E4U45_007009 [Claviceps purpurea]|nr:hypothetical protein E4U45_007009 [Claviceps purpurea]
MSQMPFVKATVAFSVTHNQEDSDSESLPSFNAEPSSEPQYRTNILRPPWRCQNFPNLKYRVRLRLSRQGPRTGSIKIRGNPKEGSDRREEGDRREEDAFGGDRRRRREEDGFGEPFSNISRLNPQPGRF